MTTSKLIEQLHVELTTIHGGIHPDVAATIESIGERLDLFEKCASILVVAAKKQDVDGFRTMLNVLETALLPPPVLPDAPPPPGVPTQEGGAA